MRDREKRRGQITRLDLRGKIIDMVKEAREKGAPLKSCCEIVGIAENTYRSWIKNAKTEDKRTTVDKSNPANKLTDSEIKEVYELLYSEEYADKTPHKIVPQLADKGKYICSESTMYRLLKEDKANKIRTLNRKENAVRMRPNLVAERAGQVYNWDITYLPTLIKGIYFRALLIIDMFSRRIMSYKVFYQDTLSRTQEYIKEEFVKCGLRIPEWIHGDNGKTLKGKTLANLLRSLGVIQSHSRPHVSNDNAYIESFFGTMKTNFRYPKNGFETLEEADRWLGEFIEWYNNEPHSGINYVSPNQRYSGEDKEILERRKKVFEEARIRTPERFGKEKEIKYQNVVTLTPMTGEEITEYIENERKSGKR